MEAPRAIRPQPGFQERFLSTPADIAIGGGSAGCGKSWAAILEPLRHCRVRDFYTVFFRRTTPQITNPGGLLDATRKIYPMVGATPNLTRLEWSWPQGARVKLAHLEREDTVHDWQGSEIALLCFDELTHFLESQFWYMLSRNRSMCGVRPYVRATCNPDADSWVARLIAWWLDPETGFPIPERAGKLRWFARIGDEITWGNSPEEVRAQCPDVGLGQVKSLTFVPGKLRENQELLRVDPAYEGNLKALGRVERARLLDGNWKIRPSAGLYFKKHEVTLVDSMPTDVEQWVRRWDLASTEPSEENKDPDWTCGVKMGKRKNGRYVVAHAEFLRKRSDGVRAIVRSTAEHDGCSVRVGLPQDPGQAGVDQKASYTKLLAGFTVWFDRETGDKITRADPFASQWQHGNVDVVRGPWNAQYFDMLEGFPSANVHDDPVDASSGAFAKLLRGAAASYEGNTGSGWHARR